MFWKAQPIVNRVLVVLCNVVWSNCPDNTAFSGGIQQTYRRFDYLRLRVGHTGTIKSEIANVPASPAVSQVLQKGPPKTIECGAILVGCHALVLNVSYTGIKKSGRYQACQPVLLFHKSSKTIK